MSEEAYVVQQVDLARAVWRTSTYSGGNGHCVEVAFVGAAWRKSTYSSTNGQCVEVAFAGDAVAVRDTKNRDGAVLAFTPGEWSAFVGGVTAGEFGRA